MIVLGIDTSSYTNALGIVDDGNVLAELNITAVTSSIANITIHIDKALKKANIGLGDIQGIGVGSGPGSWTGIRISVTVGKMLAFSLNKPLVGIPTLEILAYAVRDKLHSVIAVIDVGAGDTVYAGKYRVETENVTRLGEYYVGDIEGLASLIKEPVILVGMKAHEYSRIVAEKSGTEIEAVELRPSGATLASLAAHRLSSIWSDDVLSLTPLYLKESTAKAFVNKYRTGHR